jgi:hypothetical protein
MIWLSSFILGKSSWFCLRPSDHGYLAVECWPAFDAFPIAGFPVRKLGEYSQAGIKVETERRPILEQNNDCLNVWINLDRFHDFAFDFGETSEIASTSFSGMRTF